MATIVTITLYNSAGTILASQTLDGDRAMANYNLASVLYNPFPEVKLREGETYRMSIKNDATSAFINGTFMPAMDYPDAMTRETCFGPGQLTTRVDGGSWTETDTKACPIIPVMKFITTAKHRYF